MLFHGDLVGMRRMFRQYADPLRLANRDNRIFEFAIGPLAQLDREAAAFLARRIEGRIGQDHQRCLQPLGTMHGHQPHFVAALDLLALDLDVAAVEPVEKALQRRDMVALEGQCRGQQLVERVDRRMAEPRQQFAATLHRSRHDRLEKLVGRVEIGHRQQLLQRLDFTGESVLPAQIFPEALVRMILAAIAAREQILLRPAKQRRHQPAGEIEIVMRLQREADRRQQVLHHQRLVEPDPVDARHRHLFRKQSRDNQRAEIVALAHQNQNVLGFQRPVFPVQPQRIVWRQPLLDLQRQLLGKDPFLLAGPGFLVLIIGFAAVRNRLP